MKIFSKAGILMTRSMFEAHAKVLHVLQCSKYTYLWAPHYPFKIHQNVVQTEQSQQKRLRVHCPKKLSKRITQYGATFCRNSHDKHSVKPSQMSRPFQHTLQVCTQAPRWHSPYKPPSCFSARYVFFCKQMTHSMLWLLFFFSLFQSSRSI